MLEHSKNLGSHLFYMLVISYVVTLRAQPALVSRMVRTMRYYGIKTEEKAKVVADQSYIEIEYPPRRQSTTTFVCLIIQVRGGVVV